MFRINSNVDYNAINELIGIDLELETLEIIIGNLAVDENNNQGEIDQSFFAYLILKLVNSKLVKNVHFLFDHKIEPSRIFSLQYQLEHLKIILKQEIKLFQFETIEDVDTDTGEITEKVKILGGDYLNKNELHQSGAFAYPLFISKEKDTTSLFFSPNSQIIESDIYQLYFRNVLSHIKSKIGPQKDDFISKLMLTELSFVEIVLLNLSLYDKIKLLPDGRRTENWRLNQKKIRNLIKFATNISKGLKELALNIEDHSDFGKGVITIRSFDRKRISMLKSLDEKKYIEDNDYNWFLDINVIDLGNISVRRKYIENISRSIDGFKNVIDSKKNISQNRKSEITKIIVDDLEKDIAIINNDKEFGFKDFFLINTSRKSLNHQKNKLHTRIGLQFFTQLVIKKYSGFIKTSSGNEKSILFFNDETDQPDKKVIHAKEFSNKGTAFSCLIPLNNWEKKQEIDQVPSERDDSATKNSFDYLNKFSIINFESNLNDIDQHSIIRYVPDLTNFDAEKYNANLSLSLDFIGNPNFQKSILLINYDDIHSSQLKNESYWLRFLWALNDNVNTIIIYNNPVDHFREICFLRQLWNMSGVDFWEKEKRILFYSKKHKNNDTSSEYYRFGANILCGSTYADFNIINNNIWNHHYSHKEDVFISNERNQLSDEGERQTNSILFKGKNLHYFEVILQIETKQENKISLFEKSVQYSLNTLFIEKESAATNNKGYKIEHTHFKLGSKIHISDFYYAKKLFQNSFFTTPLAYLISVKIKDNHPDELHNLSIIGYETYSGFLVSTIRNFLSNDDKNSNKINQFVIDKNGILSRELKKLNKKVILITPIASTFNTSLRIEDQIRGIERRNEDLFDKKIEFLEPFYNCVLVAHREVNKTLFEGYTSERGEFKEDNIYANYKWKKVDISRKEITIQKYDEGQRRQQYLVPVYTEWQEASTCTTCFSANIEDEQCLIETGQASITPQLIFGFPKTKPVNKEISSSIGLCLENSLLYGNLYKKDNSYLYYNRTGKVIANQKNFDNIKNWLLEKIKPIFDEKHAKSKIVIVTPASGSHSQFIDLINEKVFDFRANCIVISLKEDYIENTESLYSDGLHQADVVVFVDDVLSTINSFLETNYIVKYIREKNSTGKGIDYCISLINRMSFSNEENLLLKLAPIINNETSNLIQHFKTHLNLKRGEEDQDNLDQLLFKISKLEKDGIELSKLKEKLLYYTKINNSSIEEANKKFPLTLERKRYDDLSKLSSLDAVRTYFNNKKQALNPVNISKNPSEDIKDYSDIGGGRKNKKLYQLLVLNALYEIFEIEKDQDSSQRLERINTFFPKTNKGNENNYLTSLELLRDEIFKKLQKDNFHSEIIQLNTNNLENVIIKVICSTPLIYYKDIREVSFKWVNALILKITNEIKSDNFCLKEFFKIRENSFYSTYRTLKFLLKKSVRLKSNFILHEEFFYTIRTLLDALNDATKIMELNAEVIKSISEFDSVSQKLLNKYSGEQKVKLQNFINDTINEGILDKEQLNVETSELPSINEIPSLLDFGDDLDKLKSIQLYKTSSPKKVIYHLVSLVQELIFDNETKAYELDKNITSQIKNNTDSYIDNTKNGDYQHYLRLLRLENTEVLDSLSTYVLSKYSEQNPSKEKEILISNLEKTLQGGGKLDFSRDDKYKLVLEKFQGVELRNNLNGYLLLKSQFNNFFLNSNYLEGETIEEKINPILNLCQQIIGESTVNNINLSVNYNNKPSAGFKDYYHFHLKKTKSEFENDSITALFTKNILAENNSNGEPFTLSNIEIIKSENGECIIRDKIFSNKRLITESSQFKFMSNDTSLLTIRISDFQEIIEGKNNSQLYTQGILTFYLNKGERVNEKKLRLILGLRHDFSRYLKTKTSGTTFLELVERKKDQIRKKSLKHHLEKYFTNLDQQIIQYGNNGDKSNYLEFEITKNAIKGQVLEYTADEVVKKSIGIISSQLLVNPIKIILMSDYLGGGSIDIKEDKFDYSIKNKIVLPKIIYSVIIPQLIINLKQYSHIVNPEYSFEFKDEQQGVSLIFKNTIDPDTVKNREFDPRPAKGKEMINEIVESYNENSTEHLIQYNCYHEDNNIYVALIILKPKQA